ncbi:carboxylesterase family protein [Sphingomonas sp. XMGL2]|uniref:Carboxylic ester hydrolase n=2 Tax=Sphingomonas quercus TaxID=2842451 RepID=A0ABS6BJ51_9SPHN|nr:carboxylesterase family protein [Sphingomonas quercus]
MRWLSRMRAGLFVYALLSSSGSFAQAIVHTETGDVLGNVEQDAEAFKGIPYAQPPIGPLRWRDPVPATRWSGVRDGTRAGDSCIQTPSKPFGPFGSEFLVSGPTSEDCLYLNVWRPRHRSDPLPVYVFVHGGAFANGSSAVPIYDGAGLARQGVIVVTINYRVGVFGFLAHPQLTRESEFNSSGNYGLLDQIEALRWVRANIAAFGGDPENVTIAGQSAGGLSVNNLLTSPEAKGLFKRAVAESGTAMGIHMLPLREAEARGAAFAQKLGAASIDQLRAIPADVIQAAVPTLSLAEMTKPPVALPFAPVVDGTIIPAEPEDVDHPVTGAVPLLTGYNSDDYILMGVRRTPAAFAAHVRDRYGSFADRILALYPHATDHEAAESSRTLSRDEYMTSMILFARKRERGGQPVYLYLFDYKYLNAAGQDFGAFHTAEVPFIFGALDKGGRSPSENDRRVTAELQSRWLAFIRSGDPSAAAAPWPRASERSLIVMGLGTSNAPRPGVSSQQRFDVLRDFAASGGTLAFM